VTNLVVGNHISIMIDTLEFYGLLIPKVNMQG